MISADSLQARVISLRMFDVVVYKVLRLFYFRKLLYMNANPCCLNSLKYLSPKGRCESITDMKFIDTLPIKLLRGNGVDTFKI